MMEQLVYYFDTKVYSTTEVWVAGRKTGRIEEIYYFLKASEYFAIVYSMPFVMPAATVSSRFPEMSSYE